MINLKLPKLAIVSMMSVAMLGSIGTSIISSQSNNAIIAHAKDKNKSKSSNSSDSTSGGTQNPTEVPMDTYTKHTSYPFWLQYWGPWASNFGGSGHGGKNYGGGNVGCVSTSMAIQAARGGATKRPGGGEWNPLGTPMVGGATQMSYKTGNGLTVTRGSSASGGGSGKAAMSNAEALKEAQKIASRGDFPILRTNNDGHTVAYWKAGNGIPLVYDPARNSSGQWAKFPANVVDYVRVSGKGAKKFNPNDPGPDNASAGSSDSNSDSNKDSSTSNQPKIKPVFNPFYSPTVHVLPADQTGNQTMTGAQIMQFADSETPAMVNFLRTVAYLLTFLYPAIIIICTLIAIVDEMSGGLIANIASDKPYMPLRSFMFPKEGGGALFGLDNSGKYGTPVTSIVISSMKKSGVLFLMLAFIAIGGLSWATSQTLMFLHYVLGL